jgi:hypothetical protein
LSARPWRIRCNPFEINFKGAIVAKVMFTARIEAEEEEFLKDLGGGDRTAGFRLLLSRGMKGALSSAKPAGARELPPARAPIRPGRPTAPAHPGYAQAKVKELVDAGAKFTVTKRPGFVGKR